MKGLFDSNIDFDRDLFRNIVSLRESECLFDDLTGDDADLHAVAVKAEMRVKRGVPRDIIPSGFHYSTAIECPFIAETYYASRYGDGTFPVLYGSVDLETTIHETCYHMVRFESRMEGIDEVIVRDRSVYLIHGQAVLIDLSGKGSEFPQLLSNEYSFTQQIGKRLSEEGHPGIMAPSARCDGINVVFFRIKVLSDPRIHCYLTYRLDPATWKITVERRSGEVIEVIEAGRWIQ